MEKEFTLTITGTQHGEWQGHLKNEGGQNEDFQSLMELIKIINKEVKKEAI